jgi:very-short-patch-repair endonuclease
VAAKQHACIALRQCLEVGMSRSAVKRLTARRAWTIVGPAVYRVNGAPMTWHARVMAAVLAAGPDALASHRTAAHLWGLDGFGPTGRIEITVPRHTRRWRRSGVTVHETLAWNLTLPTTRWGIPVVGAPRALIDVAAVAHDEVTVLRALDEIRRRRLATWPQLWETFILHARRGRPGIVVCRAVLERRYGQTVPHGEFARLFMRMLEDAGLPAGKAEHPIVVDGHAYRVDLAYPDHRLAIELDDKGSHSTDAAFEADRIRDNRLRVGGWTVLRYTWQRFIETPSEIVAEVRAALDPNRR